MPTIVEDYRHPFVDPLGRDAVCAVRIYRPADQTVIVLAELPANPGAPISIVVASLAAEIWALENQPPLHAVVVIEHYPPRSHHADPRALQDRMAVGTFDRVFLAVSGQRVEHDRSRLERPLSWAVARRQPLVVAEVEAIIGETWTPIPTD